MPTTSLLISTYNWPEALRLCLDSVMVQSLMPDEIIICDDGSKAETRTLIESYKNKFAIPLVHVWQEDQGFQLAKIRNKGFAAAQMEYLIQVDGDLILHKDFVRDHAGFSKKGFFTTGSRVLLSPETTADLISHHSIDIRRFSKNNNNLFNGLHLPFLQNFLATRYKNKGRHRFYVKGCNMAFFKNDLILVNGYNEDFTGWGREDSELAIRLINAGVKKRFLKFGGISYHLFHKEASRDMEQKNIAMMQSAIENNTSRAENGLDKYF